jgi:hypothetical protein
LFFSTGVRDLFSLDELLCRSFFSRPERYFFFSFYPFFSDVSLQRHKFLVIDFMSSQIAPSTKVDKTCLKFHTENHVMSFSAFPKNQLNPTMRDIVDMGGIGDLRDIGDTG